MDHRTGPHSDDIDLDFSLPLAGHDLPSAVDEHGIPIALGSSPRQSAAAAHPAGSASNLGPDLEADPAVLDLPHGDWTRVDGDGRWPWPPGSRASAFAKATVAALAVMVLVPLIFMLAPLVGISLP